MTGPTGKARATTSRFTAVGAQGAPSDTVTFTRVRTWLPQVTCWVLGRGPLAQTEVRAWEPQAKTRVGVRGRGVEEAREARAVASEADPIASLGH